MNDFSKQMDLLERHSTYARRWLSARPDWAEWLHSCGQKKIEAQDIQDLLSTCRQTKESGELDEAQFMAQLRLARQRLLLWIARIGGIKVSVIDFW